MGPPRLQNWDISGIANSVSASFAYIEETVTDVELENLLSDLESDRVERKESLSDNNRYMQIVCAFSNDMPNHQMPGVCFIGATDAGTPSGLEITDDLLLRMANLARDGKVLPIPSLVIEKRNLFGIDVAVAIVEPTNATPVRVDGRTWIRVGPRRAVATPEEEKRLSERRRGRDLPFDIQPVPSATIEDLDLDTFRRDYLPAAIDPEVLAQNQRTEAQRLSSLRFIADADAPVPTVLGLLTVGKDPRRFLAGAYVQFLRISGTALGDPIRDSKELDGSLLEILRDLDEVIRMNISTALLLADGPTDVRIPDYPLEALRQLTRNAILHRTYEGTGAPVRISWFDDRIEIQNPGGPYGMVNRANFGSPGITDYRNPHIAEAMKNLGYVQRFGMGIQITKSELAKNGNPNLVFVVEEAHVLAIVRTRA